MPSGYWCSRKASNSQHHHCPDLIFVDTSSNAQTALQACGRGLRMGQARICCIYMLTINRTHSLLKFCCYGAIISAAVVGEASVGTHRAQSHLGGMPAFRQPSQGELPPLSGPIHVSGPHQPWPVGHHSASQRAVATR